mmetsp:Transcript_21276/g.72072  ORF Transcript_21276/g.72072 Transcript_21276/m.72072 type:complete len:448 (-) Transcript_21276:273-1616(-)
MTCEMRAASMPRAPSSVATTTVGSSFFGFLLRRSASMAARRCMSESPARGIAGVPRVASISHTRTAASASFTKTMAASTGGSELRSTRRSESMRSTRPLTMTFAWASFVGRGEDPASTRWAFFARETSTESVSLGAASPPMRSSIVADARTSCASLGSALTRDSTSFAKGALARASASSRTQHRRRESFKAPSPNASSASRPGVPTMAWGFVFFSFSSCRPMFAPPQSATHFAPPPMSLKTSAIWLASSRPGTTTRSCGLAVKPTSMASMAGRRKASVLPDPVGARRRASCSLDSTFSAADCTAVAVLRPFSRSLAARSALTSVSKSSMGTASAASSGGARVLRLTRLLRLAACSAASCFSTAFSTDLRSLASRNPRASPPLSLGRVFFAGPAASGALVGSRTMKPPTKAESRPQPPSSSVALVGFRSGFETAAPPGSSPSSLSSSS